MIYELGKPSDRIQNVTLGMGQYFLMTVSIVVSKTIFIYMFVIYRHLHIVPRMEVQLREETIELDIIYNIYT